MKCKYCGCSLTRDRAGVLHDTEIPFLTSVCHRSPERPLPVHVVVGGYKAGDLVEDYTEGGTYAREILDPQGEVICLVIETDCKHRGYEPSEATQALLSHLNK